MPIGFEQPLLAELDAFLGPHPATLLRPVARAQARGVTGLPVAVRAATSGGPGSSKPRFDHLSTLRSHF